MTDNDRTTLEDPRRPAQQYQPAFAPKGPDAERVRSSMHLHELATSLQRQDPGLSYKGAVLAASRMHDAQPAGFEFADDDRGALHREAETYRIAHEVSYKEAVYAVDRRRATTAAPATIAAAPIDDNAELHAAAVVRMAREPGLSYREALVIEAGGGGPRPGAAPAIAKARAEDTAPTEAEVTAFMKAHGGSYKAALVALMIAAAAAQKGD